MMQTKRISQFLLLVAVCIIAMVHVIAERHARQKEHASGLQKLHIHAMALESMLEKYETLPYILGLHGRLTNALNEPEDRRSIDACNTLLQISQRRAFVAAIFLIDPRGTTICASNWDQPKEKNFVGNNYSFRPYFLEALKGRVGHFYGIGNTTGEPGYFISMPVYDFETHHGAASSTPLGILAVKIDLIEIERTWTKSDEPIVLTDRKGVVFLSNRERWKYRSLAPLSEDDRVNLQATRQYADHQINAIDGLADDHKNGFGSYISQPVGKLGWKLLYFPSEWNVKRYALYVSAATALVIAIMYALLWAAYQRRKRLQERAEARGVIRRATTELEAKIAVRNGELLSANQNLMKKLVELQKTEHMLRSTQNELVQAGKLAMLGQMAAGVTHELSQPLATIRAFADNGQIYLSRNELDRANKNFDYIRRATERMATIVSGLKEFARKTPDTVETMDLGAAVRTVASLMRSDFEERKVDLSLQVPGKVLITGNPTRVDQILINLMRNALDAVETSSNKWVAISVGANESVAVVHVLDSGPGLTEEVLEHMFEPFFTTKPAGKGLGLGLAISSSIAHAMGGTLKAQSTAGMGAKFLLELPLATKNFF
jgi:two-component system C4-dicarboxylate transport sensor histidine kinase DctB